MFFKKSLVNQNLTLAIEHQFQNLSGGFQVVLFGPGSSFEKEIEAEKNHKLEISERQAMAIDYLKKHDRLTRREYVKMAAVSSKTAYLELYDLVNKGIVMVKGKGRSVIYLLSR